MRIGILGGTFDPIHYGHLLLAETCREVARLDQVWFLPAAMSPHKQHQQAASPLDRCRMIELAIAGHAAFALCTIELERGGVSYTVDTLTSLRSLHSDRTWFFILGADSLVDFPSWRAPDRICALATLLVSHRPLEPTPDLRLLHRFLPANRSAEQEPQTVAMPLVEFSSRDLRARIAAGRSIRYRTPNAVVDYIAAQHLYQSVASSEQTG